jgi:hypothetical protein
MIQTVCFFFFFYEANKLIERVLFINYKLLKKCYAHMGIVHHYCEIKTMCIHMIL